MSRILLAGALDWRDAQHLSLRRQQPVRRRARQAPLGGDAGELSDAQASSQAGLYRGLLDLKASLERYRASDPEADVELESLGVLIQAQAAAIDLRPAEPAWRGDAPAEIATLAASILEARIRADPARAACRRRDAERGGARRHAVGDRGERVRPRRRARSGAGARRRRRSPMRPTRCTAPPTVETRADLRRTSPAPPNCSRRITNSRRSCARWTAASSRPSRAATSCARPRSCRPGRNLHGFDPYRIPSAYAVADGARQVASVLGAASRRRTRLAGIGGAGALGNRQSEERRRPDRAGARAARRAAALRRLRAALRRRADPARRTRPSRASTSSSRCRASSATCCRCRRGCSRRPAIWRPRRMSPRTSNYVRKHALAYQPPSMAAISKPLRCACSATPRAPMARMSAC